MRSLPEGIAEYERLTGVRAATGGRHPDRGTENALVSLGDGGYLEIIAPQPGATLAPSDERMRGMDRLQIITWAVAVDDVDESVRTLEQAGAAVGPRRPGSRVTPSGERLEWTTFSLADPAPATAPFFIHWGADARHPSQTAPGVCALTRLSVEDPAAARLAAALEALRVTGVGCARGGPRIEATIRCGSMTAILASA